MLNVYADFAEEWMAMPVLKGLKTPAERFAGAIDTYCIEALMQDGKSLQVGTSHFLGQNFAKAFDVKFLNKEGTLKYVWATSWGVSTRLIGALVMAHSDDDGLILPPKLAPLQAVIVPIYKKDDEFSRISEEALKIKKELTSKNISVKYDDDDQQRPGWKFAEYELQGVPLRFAIGPKDIENGTIEVARRDTKEKITVKSENIGEQVETLLSEIQNNIYQKALAFREQSTLKASTFNEFKEIMKEQGGFISAHWDGTSETEAKIKEQTKATIRCVPLTNSHQAGKCIYTGKQSKQQVIFGKAY